MNIRFLYAVSIVYILAASGCSTDHVHTTEHVHTTGSLSSGSAGMGGNGGNGGAGGNGGHGGNGGIVMDDDILCTALGAADAHEKLVASADVMSAPLMAAPDVIYDVTIPQNGGFVAVKLLNMHTTFAVYASDVESFDVSLEGTPVVETITEAMCDGAKFRRFQHHSHEPSTYVVALPPTPTNQSVVFYRLL